MFRFRKCPHPLRSFVVPWFVLVALLSLGLGGPAMPAHAAGPTHRASGERSAFSLTSRVNPFIGTGGHGHTYPGASLPFGMVQLSPDTREANWDGSSGYHYSDSRIFGFSHTHLSGTGIPDYCDVLLMPTTGEVRLGKREDGAPAYASSFSHDDERAAPGYYSVALADYRVKAELTATLRAGFHRYTFPEGTPGHVVLDLEHRDEVLASTIRFVGDREIEGMRRSRSWAQDQRVYFVARFSRPFAERTLTVDGAVRDADEADGTAIKAAVGFGDAGGEVLVKVGISAVDVEGARKNLDAEIPEWDFDNVRHAADAAWERELSKIRVEGGTTDQQTVFYTALYHAMLSPDLFVDVDGRYRGRDLEVHTVDGFDYYTVFSLWDTFRALHPLLTIVDTRRTRDFVRTFLRQYQEGGRLPVWELAANETNCMIGYHAVPVIADAIMKEIGGFDVELAYEAMKHSAEEDVRGLDAYKAEGYIPADHEPESVSKTLEYAYDDWCIAMVARKLGRTEDYDRYIRRAQSYKHLFDPKSGFMRARMEGAWFTPFDPAEVNFNYTEANAWQYSLFVPQDVDGLVAMMGGRRAFARKLDALFQADSTLKGNQQADITGLIGQYAHGNEPSHHMAYLYAFVGQPWKTQALVREIVETLYRNDPDGLAGNEDCGQMSAWLVLSALGFYPVTPGSNQYVLGTPMFPKATIRLESGREFVVSAPEVSSRNLYVQGVTLNGKRHSKAYVEHAELMAGGELRFEMGDRPNRRWGTGTGNEPRSAIVDQPIVPAPVVVEGDLSFADRTRVRLAAAPGDAIHVTLDGSEPTATSPQYRKPLVVDRETVLKAVAIRPGAPPSPTIAATFRRRQQRYAIRIVGRYTRQYSAGGDEALIDGLRGRLDYRLGRWQGYQGGDLEATVDLGRPRQVRRFEMGFLQTTEAWILMPRRVVFSVSDDGRTFTQVGTVENDLPIRDMQSQIRAFAVEIAPREARYVRVHVVGSGPLPEWHPGAGHPSFFFTDELTIE